MAPNFQSSFIPKESIAGNSTTTSSKSILGFLGVLLVIISILASVGLFVYKGMLNGELEQLKSDLSLAESAIDKPAIDKILTFNKKLNSIKEILGRHQASSNFLALLSSSTVSSVRFSDMRYTYLGDGGLTVSMSGKSSNYASLALQENEFSKVKEIKSAKFSSLVLADNLVGFDLSLSLDPSISVYNPEIETTEVSNPSTSTADDTSLDLETLDNLDDLELTDLENI